MPHDHASAAGPGRLAPEDAKRITGAATWASLTVAAVLVLSKAVVWWMSGVEDVW